MYSKTLQWSFSYFEEVQCTSNIWRVMVTHIDILSIWLHIPSFCSFADVERSGSELTAYTGSGVHRVATTPQLHCHWTRQEARTRRQSYQPG